MIDLKEDLWRSKCNWTFEISEYIVVANKTLSRVTISFFFFSKETQKEKENKTKTKHKVANSPDLKFTGNFSQALSTPSF